MIDTIAIIESDRIERMSMLNAEASFLLIEEGRKTESIEVSTHCGGGAINTATGARLVPAEAVEGPVFAVIQPHAVALYLAAPQGSPRNVWSSTVTDIDRRADRVRVRQADEPLPGPVVPAVRLGFRPR